MDQKLIEKIAERFGVDPGKLLGSLKATAFRQRDGSAPTNEQMMALLVVADQYGLNPFTKEVYAYPDKAAGIIPVVGVDGWARILNSHPQFDGMLFSPAEKMVDLAHAKPAPEWMKCVMFRKDRSHPIEVTEYLDEVYRQPYVRKDGTITRGPWQSHTKRMLRHKTMIQAARLAFGLVGIYDQDEAERIVEATEEEQAEKDYGPVPSIVSTPVAREAVPNTETKEPPVVLSDENVDDKVKELTTRLVNRAIGAGAWSAAYQYAEERYKGAKQAYILGRLRQAETETKTAA